MGEWRLFDETSALDFGESHPFIIIQSGEQLLTELEYWVGQEPSAIRLESPHQESLTIGIGGPYCGIQWSKPPRRQNLKMAISNPRIVDMAMEFRWNGEEMGFRAQYVLTFIEAIPIILLFYKHQQLADWVEWWELKH